MKVINMILMLICCLAILTAQANETITVLVETQMLLPNLHVALLSGSGSDQFGVYNKLKLEPNGKYTGTYTLHDQTRISFMSHLRRTQVSVKFIELGNLDIPSKEKKSFDSKL